MGCVSSGSCRFATGESHRIELPEPVYAAFTAENLEFDTNVFRFRYQSLVTPESVFDYDMDKRERRLLKRTDVLGGYDPTRYVSERLLRESFRRNADPDLDRLSKGRHPRRPQPSSPDGLRLLRDLRATRDSLRTG